MISVSFYDQVASRLSMMNNADLIADPHHLQRPLLKYSPQIDRRKYPFQKPVLIVADLVEQSVVVELTKATLNRIYIALRKEVVHHPKEVPFLKQIRRNYAAICQLSVNGFNRVTKGHLRFDRNCVKLICPYDKDFKHLAKAYRNLEQLANALIIEMYKLIRGDFAPHKSPFAEPMHVKPLTMEQQKAKYRHDVAELKKKAIG